MILINFAYKWLGTYPKLDNFFVFLLSAEQEQLLTILLFVVQCDYTSESRVRQSSMAYFQDFFQKKKVKIDAKTVAPTESLLFHWTKTEMKWNDDKS